MTVDELIVKLLAYPGDSEMHLTGDVEMGGWLEVIDYEISDQWVTVWHTEG